MKNEALKLLLEIKDFYLRHETDTSKRLKENIFETERKLNQDISFLLMGSVNMGMFDETSDYDIGLIGSNSALDFINEAYPGHDRYERLKSFIRMSLWSSIFGATGNGTQDIHLVYDESSDAIKESLDCPKAGEYGFLAESYIRISSATTNQNLEELSKEIEVATETNHSLGYWIAKARIPVATFAWERSFSKYNQRLEKRGIIVPYDQLDRIDAFLKLSDEQHAKRAVGE